MPEVFSAGSPAGVTVFFDGDCPLCRSEIGLYRRCAGAGQVAFVDVAAADPGEIVDGLDQRAALARFHVQTADGRLHSGAAGFSQLWLALPGWRWLGRLSMLPGVRAVAEWTYRGFLRVRPAMQWLWRRTAASAKSTAKSTASK